MTNPSRSTVLQPRRVPSAIVATGILLEVVYVGTIVALEGVTALFGAMGLVGLVLTAPFALGIVLGGHWLGRCGLPAARYARVVGWCAGTTVVYVGLNLLLIAVFPTPTLVETVGWAIFSVMIGLAGGLLLGTIEALAIERALAAEREAVRAEQLAEQRDWFEYLNNLLRHEVLNAAHLVDGYTDLLLEEDAPAGERREYLERIDRRSREMTDVIQDVRALLQSADEPETFEPVDLVDVLSDAVAELRDDHDVTVETTWPEQAFVRADDLLARVFSNLLGNAVEHNDGRPWVGVTVEADDDADAVTVTIEDDGPGIPDRERERLFERNRAGDHGLGLYLVRTLVGRYGGSVELVETGPDGTTFAVDIPRASPAREPAAAEEADAATVDVP